MSSAIDPCFPAMSRHPFNLYASQQFMGSSPMSLPDGSQISPFDHHHHSLSHDLSSDSNGTATPTPRPVVRSSSVASGSGYCVTPDTLNQSGGSSLDFSLSGAAAAVSGCRVMPCPSAKTSACLKITQQPMQRGFRFRYRSELGSHGGLQGEKSCRQKRTYPQVKVEGWQGRARIEVSLVAETGDPPLPHVHQLVWKSKAEPGSCVEITSPEQGMEATFRGLGILHMPKKEVPSILYEKLKALYEKQHPSLDHKRISDLAAETAKKEAKAMHLNAVRLCFTATLLDAANHPVYTLPNVYSNPVYDSKAPGAGILKICRMSKDWSPATGCEEIFLLCEKIQKEDIHVRFYELDDDDELVWEDEGIFNQHDVHKQYAIVFKTPPYRDQNIQHDKNIYIQLKRTRDGATSDPRQFTYKPDFDRDEIEQKKGKPIFPTSSVPRPCLASQPSVPAQQPSGAASSLPPQQLISISTPTIHYSSRGTPPATHQHMHTQPKVEAGGEIDFISRCVDNCNVSRGVTTTPDTGSERKTGASPNIVDGCDNELCEELRRFLCVWRDKDNSGTGADALKQRAKHLLATANERGFTVLHMSVLHQHTRAVSCLLYALPHLLAAGEWLPGLVNRKNGYNKTPLYLAIDCQHTDIAQLLLANGASFLDRDDKGNTPLHLAAMHGDAAVMRTIVDKVNDDDGDGGGGGDAGVLDMVDEKGRSALHLAVEGGFVACVELLVAEPGVEVNYQQGASGVTALHLAVERGSEEMVRALVERGDVKVGVTDHKGVTPLQLALSMGYQHIATLIMQNE